MSARLAVLFGLSSLLAASPRAEAGDAMAGLGAGPLVVAPLNLALSLEPPLESGVAPVERALLDYLVSSERDVVVLERESASRLWREVMAEGGETRDEEAMLAACERFALRVAEQADFSALLLPALVARSARVTGHRARWDGVSRSVDVPGSFYEEVEALPHGPIRISRHGVTGSLAGASLHVIAMSPTGERIFEGRGGLVLLQRLVAPETGSRLEMGIVFREEPFEDDEALHEGIAAALGDARGMRP